MNPPCPRCGKRMYDTYYPDEKLCLDHGTQYVGPQLPGLTKEQRRMYMNVKAKEAVS